jgi:hypothetical protein
VEVVLHQGIRRGADSERIASGVVDLNGVAVIDAIGDVIVVRHTELGGRERRPERCRGAARGPCQVDR